MLYPQIQDNEEGVAFLVERMLEAGHEGPFYRAVIPYSELGPFIMDEVAYRTWSQQEGNSGARVKVYR